MSGLVLEEMVNTEVDGLHSGNVAADAGKYGREQAGIATIFLMSCDLKHIATGVKYTYDPRVNRIGRNIMYWRKGGEWKRHERSNGMDE